MAQALWHHQEIIRLVAVRHDSQTIMTPSDSTQPACSHLRICLYWSALQGVPATYVIELQQSAIVRLPGGTAPPPA